jgi:cation transport regulator
MPSSRHRHEPGPSALPYLTNDELPYSLRRRLPAHAQDIYRHAFNDAWEQYGRHEPDRREEIAHRVAWSAVKRSYVKIGDIWVPRGPGRSGT